MKLLRQLRALFRKEKLDAEMSEEMRAHLELQAAENEKRGLSAREAHYDALRAFGGVEQIKERARDGRGLVWLEQLLQDARYGVRALRKNFGFTAIVALTLAIGIGLNTVVFSFYRTIVAKPLAVRAPEEILRVSADGHNQAPFTFAEIELLRARLRSVDALIVESPLQAMLIAKSTTAGERQEPAAAQLVSGNFFSAFGVPVVLGRAFTAGETAVAVLSYDAWQQRFGGDRGIVGRTILLQGVPVMVVGVAPASFGGTGAPPAVPDCWVPLELQPMLLPGVDWLHDPLARAWAVFARRKAGFSVEQVGAEIDVVARAWPQPDGNRLRTSVRTATFFELHGPEVHAVSLALLFAVGLILLVGCVNVVNLLAARHAAREHEFAVRLALGANRGRLVRQLCTESVLLGLLGGAGGLLFAWWACGLIHVWTMTIMRQITRGTWSFFIDLTPDMQVFLYTLAVSLVVGLLVGLRPAWRATDLDVESALKQRGLGQSARGAWGRRNVLLVLQVAASLLLLAGAGLLLRGAARALATDPGFDSKHLLAVASWSNLKNIAPTAAEQQQRAREIAARLRTLPEVAAVAGADRLPFLGHSISPLVTDEQRWVNGCVSFHVDADYFETIGLRVVAGRSFTPDEVERAAPVVMITESAARHLWPGKDPLGRRLNQPKRARDTASPAWTVVGVVKDARFTLLSKTDDVDVFHPQAASTLWLVRTRGTPESAVQSVFAALRAIDPVLPSQADVMTMEDGPMHLQQLMAEAPATFATLLGAVALVLSSVGIYGVVAFVVARRTREIGIRFALGAQKRDVIWLVLRQTLRPALWGAAFGLVGALGLAVLLTRLVLNPEMPDLTYGAGAFPVATLAGVVALLGLVVLAAALFPARRAAKVDPMTALRTE